MQGLLERVFSCITTLWNNLIQEARVIYLLTTDRQTVIYYSTIHALELIYFDSNTQKTMKKAVRTFRFFQFSAIT